MFASVVEQFYVASKQGRNRVITGRLTWIMVYLVSDMTWIMVYLARDS